MMVGALTSLSNVKAWLEIPSNNTKSDPLLERLIESASRFILTYLQIPSFLPTTYTEWYDGYGQNFMLLRQFPVTRVNGVSINGVPVQQAGGNGISTPFTTGWTLDPETILSTNQRLTLYYMVFPRQRNSVYISYEAGYKRVDESHSVPATPGPYTVVVNDFWAADYGVKIGSLELLRVTGTPGDGEYSVDTNGVYTFNAAQESETVLISYAYVPADISQIACELVAERYKYKDRIGYNSKSLGGQETVSFSNESMTRHQREVLNIYKRVAPI